MKNQTKYLATIVLLSLPLIGFAKDHEDKDRESKPPASIQLPETTKHVDLPTLAKVTFDQALETARAAVSGSVIKAELEVEDGGLMYSFEFVTAAKQIKEVEIDAGTGRVLGIDND